jgi:uncharacterized membrane protein YraQ (UPF0718 family)
MEKTFYPQIMRFLASFSGLCLESLPFLLIGSLFSALVSAFLPDRLFRGRLGGKVLSPIAVALVAGLALPVCDCAVIPLARSLRERGLRQSAVVAFILAAPIVNPLSIASTILAFRGAPFPFFAYRLGTALAVAFSAALIVEAATKKEEATASALASLRLSIGGSGLSGARPASGGGIPARLLGALQGGTDDFFDMARFQIGGIFCAAALGAFVPVSVGASALRNPLAALGLGGLSASLLSLCSSGDAFAARSLFAPQSYLAALMFSVMGPMINLRGAAILSRLTGPRKTALLAGLVFLLSALFCLAASASWRLLG